MSSVRKPARKRNEDKLWDGDEYLALHGGEQGKAQSKELSEAARKRWRNPEYRARQVEISRKLLHKRWQEPEFRARQSEMSRRLWRDPGYRARQSESQKRWQDPEYRARQSEALRTQMRKRWQDPKYRAHMTAMCADPKYRTRMKKKLREVYTNNPELIARLSKIARKRQQTPRARLRASLTQQAVLRNNPKLRARFAKTGRRNNWRTRMGAYILKQTGASKKEMRDTSLMYRIGKAVDEGTWWFDLNKGE